MLQRSAKIPTVSFPSPPRAFCRSLSFHTELQPICCRSTSARSGLSCPWFSSVFSVPPVNSRAPKPCPRNAAAVCWRGLVHPSTSSSNNEAQQRSCVMRCLWLQPVSWRQWQQFLALTPYPFSFKALENGRLTAKATMLLVQHPQQLRERGKAVKNLCAIKTCYQGAAQDNFPSFSVNIMKHLLLGRNTKFTHEKENYYSRCSK